MGKSSGMVHGKSGISKFLVKDQVTILQLIPDRGLRNYHVESLAKTISELYTPIRGRLDFKSRKIKIADTFNFRILLTRDSISFFLIVPERLVDHFKQKVLAVWEKATIRKADSFPLLDMEKSSCCELTYRRNDIFALLTDKDINAPLPSLLAPTSEMHNEDMAIVDILLEPADRVQWEYDSNKAYEKFQKGQMPRRAELSLENILKAGFSIINNGMSEISQTISSIDSKTGEGSKAFVWSVDPERQALAARGLSTATTSKIHGSTIKTFIRIASQSNDIERGRLTMRALAGAYKDITGDNELIRRDLNPRYVVPQINFYKKPLTGGIFLSPAEVGKLIQLPTANLQDEYPIESIKQREVGVSDELFADPKGIPIGVVTERGVSRKAYIPINVYSTVQLKHIYDALCTPTIGLGQMGCGKTEGMGINWTHGFLKNGFSVFVIDTADGELARKIQDSLPEDYPDEKIIHIEGDNKHYPVSANWSDSAARQLISAEGDDLEALEMSERLTARLIDYIDGSSKSQELTERMRQYLSSAARATLTDPNKSILDVELALRSPAYREELMSDPLVQSQMDVMQDLMSLQNKELTGGSTAQIIDPIISRLKMFYETQGLARMFLQPNKLDGEGNPLLDFRKFADNPEGGYGYLVCIHASQDAWSEDGQELILSFFQDKLLMAINSRIDITQDQRKPCLNLIDEPHKFIKKAARLYKNASVELRKYRMKLLWLAHYMSQMGDAAEALEAGGVQFTHYKTQKFKQFDELGHVFDPFDSKELYCSLAEKWEAVNKVRLPSGKDSPAFIAKMEPPPKAVKSREARRQECAKIYGRPWKEVQEYIQNRRRHYQNLDEEWLQKILDAKYAEKEATKKAKKVTKVANDEAAESS